MGAVSERVLCQVPGCTRLERRARALFCSMHAERLRKKGELGPAVPLTQDAASHAQIYLRIPRDFDWPKSSNITVLETPCREYQGHRNRYGYGVRTPHRDDTPGKEHLVHRWIWSQANGPIPNGLKVLHRCDNPACFRYDHLFLDTQAVNIADMWAKGRGSAKLSPDQVREIRTALQGTETDASIARRFNVSPSTISLIRRGRVWRHVQ